ncbi:MAG: penicillin acylase family protein [Roseiflexaceae bacterium]
MPSLYIRAAQALIGLLAVLAGLVGLVRGRLRRSVPALDGTWDLPGLTAPVTVTFDQYGVPMIVAESRLDAARALGYLTARERLFQMDLFRRASAGRLAEWLGPLAREQDIRQRHYGFGHVARQIAQNLPDDQRTLLAAYSAGVNAWIGQCRWLPIEFLLLWTRPEPWTIEDSLLAGLLVFQDLTARSEAIERMLTVMDATLPADVVAFLTPSDDDYPAVLLGGNASPRPRQPVPIASLRQLRNPVACTVPQQAPLAQQQAETPGSNGWVVSGAKTADGRAILANDMHLALGVPNLWYRAALRYGDTALAGVMLPGIPLIIAGANQHIAWGYTNIVGDFCDLVKLDLHPDNPEQYRTPQGWQSFAYRQEKVRVRGQAAVTCTVKTTIWGPLAQRPLLGQPVAVHWTALEPDAFDLGLLRIDQARTLEEAIAIGQRFSGPPMNLMLAEAGGRIAWTYSGKIPRRRGFDGAVSQSWAHGQIGWDGYLAPEELPLVVDPPEGYLATANNRTLGSEYPHIIGYNFNNGYRAYRINQRLAALKQVDEAALFQLQLDTTSEFFDFYRDLALQTLAVVDTSAQPGLLDLREAISRWDGRAGCDSYGIAVLERFRNTLIERIFTPYLAPCRAADPDFQYTWNNLETPLRALLEAQEPETLPDPHRWSTWHHLLLQALLDSADGLRMATGQTRLAGLIWGSINRADIQHPLARPVRLLRRMLSMPPSALSGGLFCVRVSAPSFGAAMRLVVAAGRPERGICHMPCGQSGHPASPHYRDQHQSWVDGVALPFQSSQGISTMLLCSRPTDPTHTE